MNDDQAVPLDFFRISGRSGDELIGGGESTVHHRVIDRDGVESLSDARAVFSVYPSQIILMPGERRAVRAWQLAVGLSECGECEEVVLL